VFIVPPVFYTDCHNFVPLFQRFFSTTTYAAIPYFGA